VVLARVIGPAFGGYLTDAVSWRWAFYIIPAAFFLRRPP
jgi:MFS family permease